ncbi:hypothetical protein GCM10022403_071520 [Streptomyces coacervatus]|uniref:Polysaccharide deacetylase family protein n=1 Tax=Streptomyces coacervatus TaxID=647381 RepID=A0ABP7IWC8_9ACTN|nr:hypothetical protein [Streptomyces coacervatus]MDF2269721.1 hypothetical protein [Streptomyces coacervatus]
MEARHRDHRRERQTLHPTPVAAVPEILRTLTARGYHFVTVSQLRATL